MSVRCCTVQLFTGALEQLVMGPEMLVMLRAWKLNTRVSSQVTSSSPKLTQTQSSPLILQQ